MVDFLPWCLWFNYDCYILEEQDRQCPILTCAINTDDDQVIYLSDFQENLFYSRTDYYLLLEAVTEWRIRALVIGIISLTCIGSDNHRDARYGITMGKQHEGLEIDYMTRTRVLARFVLSC